MLHVSSMNAFMTWIKPNDYLRGTIITLIYGLLGGLVIFFISFSPKVFDVLNTQEFKATFRRMLITVVIFRIP